MKLSTILEIVDDTASFDLAWKILRAHFDQELNQIATEDGISVHDAAVSVNNALINKGALVLFTTLLRGLQKKDNQSWVILKRLSRLVRGRLIEQLERHVTELAKGGGENPPTQH